MSTVSNTMQNPNESTRTRMNTKTVACLSMLTAIAFLVMLLSKLMPSVAGFLDFDFKDTIITIGGFVFGPMAAALVSIVVAIIELVTVSTTGPVGLIMNVLATCSFCCTASFVYKKKHSMSGAVLGLAAGTVLLTLVMILWNFLITPIYMGIERAAVVEMLVPIFLPFNLVKGGMNMAATLLLYKPVVTALRKARLVAPSESGAKGRFNTGFLLFSLALLATFLLLMLVLAGVL